MNRKTSFDDFWDPIHIFDFTSSIFYILSPPFETIITIICIIIGMASLNWILPLSQTLKGSHMGSVLPGKLDKWGNRVSEKLKIPWGHPARQWQRWASVLCPSDSKAGDFSMMQALHSKYNPSPGKVLAGKVAKSGLTLCDLRDCSTPGSSVLQDLPEFIQIHVHGVGDAIQLSHPLSPPSPPVFNLSQHQGLFQWVGSLHQVANVL